MRIHSEPGLENALVCFVKVCDEVRALLNSPCASHQAMEPAVLGCLDAVQSAMGRVTHEITIRPDDFLASDDEPQ